MLYLSLALIFLGILIFAYSIILDAKKRHKDPLARGSAKDASPERMTSSGNGSGMRRFRNGGGVPGSKGEKNIHADADDSRKDRGSPVRPVSAPQSEKKAVLFEDSSHVIDYSTESGSIDPSLEGYKNIKRIGSGQLAVEKGGITFFMGKKLYRFDFHRVRDVKSGSRHLAIFLEGSDAVRLFIIESGSGIITAVSDAYREYLRSSA
jgi:hypothetical protein